MHAGQPILLTLASGNGRRPAPARHDRPVRRIKSADGVRVALHPIGGSGPPLVLLHATGFCGLAYGALGRGLTGRFSVHALDFRGHGDSERPADGGFDWGSMTDDLLAVADLLGDGPLRLFGHSLGGGVAMLAALRRPGAVGAAYLYEPIVVPDGFEGLTGTELVAGARRRRAAFPSRAEALWRYARRPPLDALQAAVLADYVEHGMHEQADGSVRLKCRPEDEAATFGAAGKPTLGTLADVRTPVVVAAGAAGDPAVTGWTPAHLAPLVAQALPAGRLEEHPTLGHLGPLENPGAVAEQVLAALADSTG